MNVKRVTTIDGQVRQHAEHPLGIDYALCGLSLDDDSRINKSVETREGRVTCEHCRIIINYCKLL